MPDVANVIVRDDKCYTCGLAQTEAGFYVDSEPVFVTSCDTDELLTVLEKVVAFGHPMIPKPTLKEMRARTGIIPSAAGVNNWKGLAQGGASYSIQWGEDGTITLFMSRLDEKGRFEWDPTKTRTFARNTSLRVLVEAILEDVRSRHTLMET